jgi:hypothetical protein
MSTVHFEANPFALLMDPQAVLSLVERSQSLDSLHRRVHRPLDKPQIPHTHAAESDAFDRRVDAEPLTISDGSELGLQ